MHNNVENQMATAMGGGTTPRMTKVESLHNAIQRTATIHERLIELNNKINGLESPEVVESCNNTTNRVPPIS